MPYLVVGHVCAQKYRSMLPELLGEHAPRARTVTIGVGHGCCSWGYKET